MIRTTILSATPNVPGVRGKKPAASSRGLITVNKRPHRWQNAAQQHASLSQPSTSSQRSQSSPSLQGPSHSAEIQKALRFSMLHLLAVAPITVPDILKKAHCKKEQCLDVLRKIAKVTDIASDEWQLTEKAYKELDVWKFPYPSQEVRQSVIDNAIKVFDRMRISPEDPQWQILLPKLERGKGITLSKLKLSVQSMKQPRKGTPVMKTGKNPLPAKKPVKKITDNADEKRAGEQMLRDSANEEELVVVDGEDGGVITGESRDAGAAGAKCLEKNGKERKNSGEKVTKAPLENDKGKKKSSGEGKAVVNKESTPKIGNQLKSTKQSSQETKPTNDSKNSAELTSSHKAKDKTKPAKSNAAGTTQMKPERQLSEAGNLKATANGKLPSSQNTPKETPLSSSDPIRKSSATAPKPFATHWLPRKEPVIRKGPKNPSNSRRLSQSSDAIDRSDKPSQKESTKPNSSNKPKNPSPLGARPLVNSPAASSSPLPGTQRSNRPSVSSSDSPLKRKANDLSSKEGGKGGFEGDDRAQKHRKTNTSVSSLSSQFSASSAGQDVAEKSLKRKSPSSAAGHEASPSPSKRRHVEASGDGSKAAKAAGVNSSKRESQVKPETEVAGKLSTSTTTSKQPNATLSAQPTAKPRAKASPDDGAKKKPPIRHSPSNSTSTVASSASDGSSITDPAVPPPLTSASTSSASSGDEGKDGGRDGTSSPPLPMSFSQTVERARKFQQHYIPYKELYERLSNSPDPPSEKDRATLMGMHDRLSVMKMEIKQSAQQQ